MNILPQNIVQRDLIYSNGIGGHWKVPPDIGTLLHECTNEEWDLVDMIYSTVDRLYKSKTRKIFDKIFNIKEKFLIKEIFSRGDIRIEIYYSNNVNNRFEIYANNKLIQASDASNFTKERIKTILRELKLNELIG